MSDLAATNCGGGCGCENNSGMGCNSIIWIILLLCCCGNGNGLFGGRNDCGCDNNMFIIIILLFCCNGNNSLFGGCC